MAACQRCSALPEAIAAEGVLYLAPPHPRTFGAVRAALSSRELPVEVVNDEIIAIPLSEQSLAVIGSAFDGNLSAAELDDTRAILLPSGREPGLGDLMRSRPLTAIVAQVRGRWLLDVLREERVVTWFQPIVHTRDVERVFAYECLLRGVESNGQPISPKLMFDLARDANLIFHLDRIARLTAIKTAASKGIAERIFVNFNPTSIYNPESCLRSTIAAINDVKMPHDRIVFEVVESEEIRDTGHLLNILDFYRNAGFRVALDDVGSGYSSLNLLAQLRPDFIKIDAELTRGLAHDSFKAGLAARLLDFAASEGIESVCEGVETEADWLWLRDHGATYAQGYYFAKPSADPRPSLAPR